MLWTIVVILLIMWLLGFSFHIAGGLIHLLLVVALVVLVFNLVTGRRARIYETSALGLPICLRVPSWPTQPRVHH